MKRRKHITLNLPGDGSQGLRRLTQSHFTSTPHRFKVSHYACFPLYNNMDNTKTVSLLLKMSLSGILKFSPLTLARVVLLGKLNHRHTNCHQTTPVQVLVRTMIYETCQRRGLKCQTLLHFLEKGRNC